MNETDHDLLVRLDERTKTIQDELTAVKEEIEKYTPLLRYIPVERVVYGLVALILVAVMGTILTIVLK